jgi:outer membrane immunogenic protein
MLVVAGDWTIPAADGQSASGGEYAFTNFVTGFIEYDYYDFGNRDRTFVQNNGLTFIYGIDETKHVVKAGLNLRFGGYGYRFY